MDNSTALAGLSGAHLNAYEGWRTHITRALRSFAQESVRAPLFISRSTLEQSGYLGNFPQQVMSAHAGADTETADIFLTPASCLHIYAGQEGKSLHGGAVSLIEGTCVRHENGKWDPPYRLPAFTMLECVFLGSVEEIDAAAKNMQKVMEEIFAGAAIPVSVVPATDAFFLGSNEGARLLQQLKGLKKEFTVTEGDKTIALASLNLHEDYFGKKFSITKEGAPVHSLCAAFGIERLAIHSVTLWGKDTAHWPAPFRS